MGWAQEARRHIRRILRAPPEPPASAPTRLLVTAGLSRRQALAAFPEIEGPSWRSVRASRLQRVDTDREWDQIAVVASSVAVLRAVAPLLRHAGRSAEVVLAVGRTDRAYLLQPVAAVGRTEVLRAEFSRVAGPGPVRLALGLAAPTTAAAVVAGVACRVAGHGQDAPAAGLRLGLTADAAGPWAAGDPTAVRVDKSSPLQDRRSVDRFDLLVGPAVRPEPNSGPPRWGVSERLVLPPVDVAAISPWGFRRECSGGFGCIVFPNPEQPTFQVRDEAGRVVADGNLRHGLTESQVESMRDFRAVHVAPPDERFRRGHARLLSQLCCAGVPTLVDALPADLADALGDQLADALRCLDHVTLADDEARETWSVRVRRAALLRFGPHSYWASHGVHLGVSVAARPRVGVVLATRRPEMVAFALAQVERQDWPELETVLVLHNVPRQDPRVAVAVAAFAGPIQVVEVPGSTSFGDALNAGRLRCSSRLITKVDDDDWYGPHHVTDLVLAHQYSGATLVGSAGYHVYLQGADRTVWVRRPTESTATWLHGGTMLLAVEDLAAMGGWRSVARFEDHHVIHAVHRAGGRLYATHCLGFVYFRGHGHTWTPPLGEEHWLDRGHLERAGFVPPPELYPLRHPSCQLSEQ